MGLFSDEKKTEVSSAAMHLIDTDTMRNPIGDSLVESVLTSGVPVATMQDITGDLIATNMNSFSLKVDRAYDYARDHYKLGLPKGASLSFSPLTAAAIAPYILAETGYPYPIQVTDHEFAQYTPMLAIAAYLRNVREYDPVTNSVAQRPPGVVYTSYFGEDPSQYVQRVAIEKVEVNADEITARVTYNKYITRPVTLYSRTLANGNPDPVSAYIEYQEVSDGLVTEDVSIPGATPGMSWGGDCLFTLYQELDAQGQLLPEYKLWVYHLYESLYPELHPDVVQDTSTYMPVIPIRYNNKDLTLPSETELYTTSKKLVEILGLNFGALGTQLNKNPSIADIDHAYVMFGVNLQSDFAPSMYYLNRFFDVLAQNQRGDEASFLEALADPTINDEPVNIQDTNALARLFHYEAEAMSEYGLSLEMRYDYIKTWVTDEVIGEEGHAFKEIVPYTATATYAGAYNTTYVKLFSRHKLVLKAQINATQVSTVEVYNLGVINRIYKNESVKVYLDAVKKDADQNGLIIPIQYQFSCTVFPNRLVRNSFYSDTLMLIINSVVHYTVKWYQKGFFKVLMVIIAVVIAIWTGQIYLEQIAAAYAAGGVIAALVLITKGILFSLVLSYAAKVFVKTVGAKLGILSTILMTIAAIVASKGFGLIGTASEFAMTSASYLLQTATAVISSANEFLIEAGEKIKNAYVAFTEKMDGLWEELEEVQDLLQWKADVDPLTFTKPEKLRILPNESPTVFFNRCLGLADNSVFSIHDEIPNFFDMRLRHKKEVSADVFNLYSYS